MGRLAHDRKIDYSELGGTLVQAACIILAIRTARREARMDAMTAQPEWDGEVSFALQLARKVLSHATTHDAEFFRQRAVEFTTGVVEEDVLK